MRHNILAIAAIVFSATVFAAPPARAEIAIGPVVYQAAENGRVRPHQVRRSIGPPANLSVDIAEYLAEHLRRGLKDRDIPQSADAALSIHSRIDTLWVDEIDSSLTGLMKVRFSVKKADGEIFSETYKSDLTYPRTVLQVAEPVSRMMEELIEDFLEDPKALALFYAAGN